MSKEEIEYMATEEIKNLYRGTSIPQNVIDAVITLAEQYHMLGIFNNVKKMTSIKEKEDYFNNSVVIKVQSEKKKRQEKDKKSQEKDKKNYEKGKTNLINYIETNIIPHIEAIIMLSNTPVTSKQSYESYEASCMLKAFAIEYILKTIEIVCNLPDEKIMEYTNVNVVEQTFSELLKGIKKKLTQHAKNIDSTARERTGHEINELLNNILPSHIATLIKYRSIANYGIEKIIANGYIPIISEKDKKAFAPDYFLLIKDFLLDNNEDAMKKIASHHNEIYKKNNKAFEEYRYKDRQAQQIDYYELNARMAASHMVLEFILKYPELSRRTNKTQCIEYKYLEKTLTEEEYDNIVRIANENLYDTNDMILYHAFLKSYLKERTPKLNDQRYTRINKLFEEIKAAGDISETSAKFVEWYSKIDLKSLTQEEIKELNVIDPNYIYKSLSYTEKLIYKKCQKYGIEFQYYYALSPVSFEKIIQLCGSELNGHSINIRLLTKTADEITIFIAAIRDMNLKIYEIPEYYYLYSNSQIIQTYTLMHSSDSSKKIIPRELLQEPHLVIDIIEGDNNQTQHHIRNQKGLLLESVINKTIDEILDSIKSLDVIQYANTISQILRMPVEEIASFNLEHLKSYLKKLILQGKMNQYDFYKMFEQRSGLFMLDKENPSIKHEIMNIQHIMDREMAVGIDMLFLESEEVCINYKMCQSEIPELKIGDFLFYKRPLEVRQIINMCKQKNIQFAPELLYFDYNLLRTYLPEISTSLSMLKAVFNKRELDFTYSDAQIINQQYQDEERKKFLIIDTTPELESMIQEIDKKNRQEFQTEPQKKHES